MDYLIDIKFRKKVQKFLKIKKCKSNKAKTNCKDEFEIMPTKNVASNFTEGHVESEQVRIKKKPKCLTDLDLDRLAEINTDITEKQI